MVSCNYCKNELPKLAIKCGYCREYTSGEVCQECQSTIPKNAVLCKHCGSKIQREADVRNRPQISFYIKTELLPTMFVRLRFLPHEVWVDNEKIVIKTPGIFNLWQSNNEIPWNKVAGFSYRDGIFWDSIKIETRGQKEVEIIGLNKQTSGPRLREILQSLEK